MKQNSSIDTQIEIAFADDHMIVRDYLTDKINSMNNCKVVFAADNGQELLQYLKNCAKLPDLCIIDINLPVLNGYDTQLFISKNYPQLKTLTISIYEFESCAFQMIKNGSNGFVSKNAGVVKLEEAIFSIYNYGNYPAMKYSTDNSSDPIGIPTLTLREKEFMSLFCTELSIEEIAEKMLISVRTVERYREKIYRKINIDNKVDLLLYVYRTGIIFMK